MKIISILAMAIIFFSAGMSWGDESGKMVDRSQTVDRAGLLYDVNSNMPITGTVVDHWPNGHKKMEIEYRDGKEHGKAITWWENGQKMSEGECHEGKMHGKETSWYDNGQKMSEGEWCDNKMQGKWINWYLNGKRLMESEYRDGKLIIRKCWDEEGNPEPCD